MTFLNPQLFNSIAVPNAMPGSLLMPVRGGTGPILGIHLGTDPHLIELGGPAAFSCVDVYAWGGDSHAMLFRAAFNFEGEITTAYRQNAQPMSRGDLISGDGWLGLAVKMAGHTSPVLVPIWGTPKSGDWIGYENWRIIAPDLSDTMIELFRH